VTVSFGEPIEINHIFEQNCSDWSKRAAEIEQKPGWYRNSLIQLSQQIMYGINRACVINPVNSIATILLATQRHSIDIDDLIAQSALQHRLIENSPRLASIHIAGPVDRDQIERIARQKLIHIRRHELGDIIYLEPQDAVLMGYYRNNSLHSLILPALIACCFTNEQRLSYTRLVQKIELLYPFLKSELQLEWQESSLLTIIDECIASMIEESLLLQTEQQLRRPNRSNPKYTQLIRIARIAQPIMERYYMTFTLLWQASGTALTETELELRCHLLAQKISMLQGINSPDFFDRLLFQDFVATMLEKGYLVKNDQQQLGFAPGFKFVSLDLRSLLSTEVRSSILSLIGK
jgi:glycerol-3-phosphate O-acyltransferase